MNNSKEYICAGLHFKLAHTTERCTAVLKLLGFLTVISR